MNACRFVFRIYPLLELITLDLPRYATIGIDGDNDEALHGERFSKVVVAKMLWDDFLPLRTGSRVGILVSTIIPDAIYRVIDTTCRVISMKENNQWIPPWPIWHPNLGPLFSFSNRCNQFIDCCFQMIFTANYIPCLNAESLL